MPSLPQSPINRQSVAFQFGVRDAQDNQPCVPEMIFVQRSQQCDYAAGWESVKGVTPTTRQFTGSQLPQPVAPTPIVNERRARTEAATYAKIVQAAEARDARIDKMLALTAEFLGVDSGDIIFAA